MRRNELVVGVVIALLCFGADYGICMLSDTTASGGFLAFVLSTRGQRITEEYGFVPAAVPFYTS
jgi:ABC-type molybdate transport system substrate-binding protein